MRRIELRDENFKVILRAFENVLSIKEFIILEKRPRDIPPKDCRQLKDGRWFIVTEVAIPNHFLYDLFVNHENKEILEELVGWFSEMAKNIKTKRAKEKPVTGLIEKILRKT
jgi:uncharacterized protein (DUF1015 family)